jgi:DNA replication protein DnaC
MPDTRQYDAGSPGTGKSHLAVALGVEAIKAGRSVYFSTLADLIASLAKAEREGTLRERIRFLSAFALLIVDEIGYLPVVPGGGNLFFQLVNARYEKGALILTSNRGFAEWGEVFGQPNTAGCRHCRRGGVSRHGHGSASRPLRAAAAARVALLRARPGLCCY